MIKKAIIPAAGLGTRMLPATKAVPKEMLTVVDKPVIQYVVEEAIASGISQILIITSKGKSAMEDHFSGNFPNAEYYRQKGKNELVEQLENIGNGCEISFREQPELNGLGDAIYMGKDFAKDEPFAVLLGDTICEGENEKPVLAQLVDVYRQHHASVTAVEKVPMDLVSRYGIMDGDDMGQGLHKVKAWVEKPAVREAPSQMAIAARYVFTPAIFACIEQTGKGLNDEVQITDAMRRLLATETMYALQFKGQRFDVGRSLGFIKTNLHFGLSSNATGPQLQDWLKNGGLLL